MLPDCESRNVDNLWSADRYSVQFTDQTTQCSRKCLLRCCQDSAPGHSTQGTRWTRWHRAPRNSSSCLECGTNPWCLPWVGQLTAWGVRPNVAMDIFMRRETQMPYKILIYSSLAISNQALELGRVWNCICLCRQSVNITTNIILHYFDPFRWRHYFLRKLR